MDIFFLESGQKSPWNVFIISGTGELQAIESMVRYKRDECLAHPVVIKFLNQKLNSRNVRLWFICNVWLYTIFLISLTLYTAAQTKGVKMELFLYKYLHMNLFKK